LLYLKCFFKGEATNWPFGKAIIGHCGPFWGRVKGTKGG